MSDVLSPRQQQNRARKAEQLAVQERQRAEETAKRYAAEFEQLVQLGARYAQMPGDDFFGHWKPLATVKLSASGSAARR